jgi:acetate kinase
MILVFNAGSSSLKVGVFDERLEPKLRGQISGIGGAGRLSLGDVSADIATADHAHAIDLLLAELDRQGFPLSGFAAAAHRVVHGGDVLTRACRIDEETLRAIRACSTLAPLHIPSALAGIEALSLRAPDLPQSASFDTAFHAGQSDLATVYALPAAIRARGIRRFGFHGLSYTGLVESLGTDLPIRLLAIHLGAGASLCAIRSGRSVATSMGYSPLSGPPMATRSGDIDPAAVLRLAAEDGIAATEAMLNQHSGLRGLSGISADMKTLLADPTAAAAFAVDHFCYWIARQAGSMIAAMEGIDAIAFTGGIGENSAEVRHKIMARLSWVGEVPVHVVGANEERIIAKEALALLAAS